MGTVGRRSREQGKKIYPWRLRSRTLVRLVVSPLVALAPVWRHFLLALVLARELALDHVSTAGAAAGSLANPRLPRGRVALAVAGRPSRPVPERSARWYPDTRAKSLPATHANHRAGDKPTRHRHACGSEQRDKANCVRDESWR